MVMIWDYDIKKLRKTESGRKLILERMINFGVDKGEKISIKQVKKYWNELDISPARRRLFQYVLWGK